MLRFFLALLVIQAARAALDDACDANTACADPTDFVCEGGLCKRQAVGTAADCTATSECVANAECKTTGTGKCECNGPAYIMNTDVNAIGTCMVAPNYIGGVCANDAGCTGNVKYSECKSLVCACKKTPEAGEEKADECPESGVASTVASLALLLAAFVTSRFL